MIEKIVALFSRPYPLPDTRRRQWVMTILLSVAVFLFLFFLRPFNGQRDTLSAVLGGSADAALIAAFLGSLEGAATVFAVVSVYYGVLFKAFPGYFSEERWTIARESLWTVVIIVAIALTNIGVMMLTGQWHYSWKEAFLMVMYTAVIGTAPATTSVIINQARLLRRYRHKAVAINQVIQEAPPLPVEETMAIPVTTTLSFIAENGKDTVSVAPADLLAVTSADNYVRLFYIDNQELIQILIRTSLQKVTEVVAAHSNFWRCHRTAIVNLSLVTGVSGTAQGYRLHVAGLPDTVPVSRSLNATLRERLANRPAVLSTPVS